MCFEIFAKRFHAQGYQPIPIRGKIPLMDNWQTVPIDASIIDHWVTIGHYGANVGIRHQPALDVDVYDEAVADQLLEWLRAKLGHGFTRRYGNRPKFLVPIKTEQQRKLMSAAYRKPGATEMSRIELLAHGQQWVCCGMHPDTNSEYTWETDPGAVPFFKTTPAVLPEMSVADIEEFFTYYESVCHDLGWEEVKPRPGQQRSVLLTPEQAAEAVRAQPSHMTPMDDFNRNGVEKIKELLNEEGWRFTGLMGTIPLNEIDGSGVSVPSERWTRPGKSSGVSATLYRSPLTGVWYLRLWSSSVPELEADAQYIGHVWAVYKHKGDYKTAIGDFRKMGFRGDERTPEEEFEDLVGDDVLAKFLERFIFAIDGPSVIDTKLPPDKAVMSLHEFKPAYINIRATSGKTKIVANAWLNHSQRATVRGVCYKPGEEKIFTDERGITWFNRFTMPEWLYTEREDKVGPVLDHLRYLLGDGMEYYLGWMSHVICKPGDRPMVTPLLISAHHGTGRGWVDELMKRLLGVWNCAATTIDALAGIGDGSGYQEYMHETVYCSIPEAKGSKAARYEINDAIRDKLTAPHAQLNLKYGMKGYTPVFTAFHMASNHRLVFSLDPVDRRVYVKECLHPPKSPDYYDSLYAWLEVPENLRQWYWWLRRYNKTSVWNPKAPAPMTREKATMCNVDADRPEAAAVVALMLDESLPAVAGFAQAQAGTIAVMKRLLPPEDHYKALIPREQLKAILGERCILALQGAKGKTGPGKTGRIYILRDNLRWVNATQEDLLIELQKWDTFDFSVLEFTSPINRKEEE